jgi:hypothetical protein
MFTPFDPFDPRLSWAVACLNVLLQGIVMRGPLGLSWVRSLIYSVLINGAAAFIALLSCPVAPRSVWRGGNPFLYAISDLAVLAVTVLIVTMGAWWRVPKEPRPFARVAAFVALSQIVWLPLALALLMIPDRPFPGLERAESRRRAFLLSGRLMDEPLVIPTFASPEEFVTKLGLPAEVAHEPRYPRFASHDVGPARLQVNTALSDFRPGKGTGTQWLVKMDYAPYSSLRTFYLDLETGEVTRFPKAPETKTD